jgi:succinyl-diaminopimelate desuccinylase
VGPKQAWTPVAEFATVGVDAINFGPGDPQYAHRDDERVDVSLLARSYHVLRAFLTPVGRAPATTIDRAARGHGEQP